ncbi:thioredoxin [Pontibacillus halophilus JSM 076056 = DSM 19796]|uniref:Thioredoxin n=1 Tax=Pontibacillus halophilus JSM 076056 = DSM 19796 TaxID=1385510 RepID=A0A0A5GBI1_9BACI|nr:thioredoxin family protein [Pontibacillus halophilus]KGX89409.1 thioredoxin [Pontibacillus halophilus JSM 076056 = DSM 19796]
MQQLQSIEQFNELKDNGKTVFMFTAKWCPDCHVIDPHLDELQEQYKDYVWVSVDRDQFIDLCIDQGIFGIPSFIAFDRGEEVGRFVSKDRKTKEEVQTFMNGLPS